MDIKFNAEALIADIQREALKLERTVSRTVAEKIETMLIKAYEDIIDQYYLYKTTSYYRHETGIGTGTGINLYRSNNISLYPANIGENDRYTGFIVDINADDMDGYYGYSKNKVLDNVLDGIRGVPGGFSWLVNKRTNRMMTMIQRETNFSANIIVNGKSYKGTPNQILDQLVAYVPEYYSTLWKRTWYSQINSGKYSYFQNNRKFNNKRRKK